MAKINRMYESRYRSTWSYYVYDLGQGQIKGQSLVLNCASLQHAGKEIY